MSKGIANQSLVAVRREPSESSEMVNQLLFGETFTIVEIYNSWLRIISNHDAYEGWLDSKLTTPISDSLVTKHDNPIIANTLFSAKKVGSQHSIKLCPGSSLNNFENGLFLCGNNSYQCIENPISNTKENISDEFVRLAKQFINSPYLWGGRSPFGIDCSGLTQVIYKILGYNIPRDAGQQVKIGETVDFINLVQPGDLAFFDNEEEIITHVGIIIGNGKIIHSSGFVKIDNLDHQGIYNMDIQKYSHKLRVIKRIL
ncbi:MAG: C40 family peptidase [Bacteroidales bacterium]|nr:C40 family peptidase [Bacteroidales bacterium]